MKTNKPNHHRSLTPVAALAGVLLLVLQSFTAQADPASEGRQLLQQTLEAHGGLEKWNAYQTLAYTMKGFPLTPEIAQTNRSRVNLKTRQNRIDGSGFVVAFDGKNAWSTPKPKASGLPSRFVTLGSFYFVGIPFVFADAGVQVESTGKQTFLGKPYDTLRITFGKQVGHSSDDNYVVFLDPASHRVALIHHNVTEVYAPDQRVTWVYDEYQNQDGLWIPKKLTYFGGWNPSPDVASGKSYTVSEIALDRVAPEAALYTAPQGASINDQP
jgi:hypothetical protein